MRYTERGEARLYQVGDRLYRQVYVFWEDGIEGYFTDTNDRGCDAKNISMNREKRKELERVGHIVIKRYK